MDFSTITKEQLKRKIDRGEKILQVDVRPFSAYWQAHIPKAVNLPFDDIADQATELLNPEDSLILYGQDERDLLVTRAAERLVGRKFRSEKIQVLQEGLVGWRGAGYFVTAGDEP